MVTLTSSLLLMSLSAMPSQELELKPHESVKLADGTTLTFVDYTVEEIAASPDDPKSYPAGSGVTFSFKLEKKGHAPETLLLSDLSAGYDSKRVGEGLGWKVTLVAFSGALTPNARAKLRVDRK
jgi:hypothetical protein